MFPELPLSVGRRPLEEFWFAALWAEGCDAEANHYAMPVWPGTGMSEAQRLDFAATCAGKMTWADYFTKWGPGA